MKIGCFALVLYLVTVYSEPQQLYGSSFEWQPNYVRSNYPAEQRLFLGTQNYIVGTSTSTFTTTRIITCTTSTAALSACTASGGRRRRSGSVDAPLFYDDNNNDESVFLPSTKVERSEKPAEDSSAKPSAPVYVPFVVEPGFFPKTDSFAKARFLLSLGTITTSTTTTTTSTSTITAICSSLTNFQLCSFAGKRK